MHAALNNALLDALNNTLHSALNNAMHNALNNALHGHRFLMSQVSQEALVQNFVLCILQLLFTTLV